MNRLEIVVAGLQAARGYTEQLLSKVPLEDWFRQPTEGVTHIAWQVGHLAVAEYAITMRRIRGTRPQDAELLPAEYHGLFGRLSVPQADPAAYPQAVVIRQVFDRVHQQALSEIQGLSAAELDVSTSGPPHPMHRTRFEALQWCGQHEFLHAGEIALLRRLLGNDPVW